MRPAPMRMLATKVATPPAAVRADAASVVERAVRAAPVPAPVRVEPPVAVPARRGGQGPREARWLVLVVIALSVVVGGVIGRIVTGGDADHGGAAATTAQRAPSTTVAPTTLAPTTLAPTTLASATTPVPVTNALGLVAGTPADPASSHPEERFAAHLGVDDAQATPASAAAIYASWWRLFGGPASSVAASAGGFAVTDAARQVLDLSGFTLGPDGKIADLVECASPVAAAPTCNRLSNVVAVDVTNAGVGQSATVSFRRLAELRLLKARTVRFVTMTSAKPVTAATSAAADVRFGGDLLAFAMDSAAVPASVDVALTYADGTSETVTITW